MKAVNKIAAAVLIDGITAMVFVFGVHARRFAPSFQIITLPIPELWR